MRPDQARRFRQLRDEAKDRAHVAYWTGMAAVISAGDGDTPYPAYVPTATERVLAVNEVKRRVALVNAEPAGPSRDGKLDRLLAQVGWLVFVERVLALDELERAALTPARLWELSKVAPEDLATRVAALSGQSVEVAS